MILEWLKNKFRDFDFHLPFLLFHDLHISVKEYLMSHFAGNELTCIPYYNLLTIEPDIIGILKFSNATNVACCWVVGEAKVKNVGVSDFRQAMFFAQMTHAFEGYLFYDGELSKDVKTLLKNGGHSYDGMNRYGKKVTKYLIVMQHRNGRFYRILSF